MFGYIVINQGEMKFKDFDIYHSYYCGLCRSLENRSGFRGQLTLTYDMTFLVVLLSALYEPETTKTVCRCKAHPIRKHLERTNIFSDYCADMNLLLTYYKCMDDWTDEKKWSRLIFAGVLKRNVKKLQKQYEEKAEKIKTALEKLREGEKNGENNLDLMAGSFGELMGEIFTWKQDEWKDLLYRTGFYLGKFIYILDAYEDVEEDREKGTYNPFLIRKEDTLWQPHYGDEGFDEKCEEMLRMMMSECSRAFEILPILECGDILRNILYSGVWTRFSAIRNERKAGREKREEKHEGSI